MLLGMAVALIGIIVATMETEAGPDGSYRLDWSEPGWLLLVYIGGALFVIGTITAVTGVLRDWRAITAERSKRKRNNMAAESAGLMFFTFDSQDDHAEIDDDVNW